MIIGKNEFEQMQKMAPGACAALSVDCGTRVIRVQRHEDYAILDGSLQLTLNQKIKDNFLYLINNEGVTKIAFFSEHTRRFYKLTPTADWPTVSISSVPMHRLASAKVDTANKIKLLKPHGCVLDTCMGCGYTAIRASETAREVITFEKDETIMELARLNPHSQALFQRPNIIIRGADVSTAIREFPENRFDCIMHDPPTFTLAPELFNEVFYRELLRVLTCTGRLFHYTPLYKVKRGFDFPSQVARTLKRTGFKKIQFNEKAGGIVCRA